MLQALAIVLLAYATLAQKPAKEWLQSCVEHAMTIISDFDAQAVANTLWALGIMDFIPAQLWTALIEPFKAAYLGQMGKPFLLLVIEERCSTGCACSAIAHL